MVYARAQFVVLPQGDKFVVVRDGEICIAKDTKEQCDIWIEQVERAYRSIGEAMKMLTDNPEEFARLLAIGKSAFEKQVGIPGKDFTIGE